MCYNFYVKKILILGGNGFIGRNLAIKISKLHSNYSIVVTSRKSNWHSDLKVLPNIELKTVSDYNTTTLHQLFQDVDVLINCIGILNETKNASFVDMHAGFMRKLVTVINKREVGRLIHISALGADANKGTSRYLRSKGAAELYLHTYLNKDSRTIATTLRPSVICGEGCGFLKSFSVFFGKLSFLFPLFPKIKPEAVVYPIYIDDFTDYVISSFDDLNHSNKKIDVVGPDEMTMGEIYNLLIKHQVKYWWDNKLSVPIPDFVAKIIAVLMGFLGISALTVDNLKSLEMAYQVQAPPNRITTETRFKVILPFILNTKSNSSNLNDLRKKVPL